MKKTRSKKSRDTVPLNDPRLNSIFPVQARRDVILSLTSMVKTSLVNFYQKTGFKPHRIIMYRQVLFNSLVSTVGAQSIAPAQSIAHGQIGDSFSQKN
jgi:hypothetical protein